uniref:Glutaredoxin domain-containing protein n=1 Tax=Eucampia antarctica TaxID=49252 RepID=A0A7S2RU60_9STRA|mmetsp:Transcript_26857/g.25727  ORF Transcript_26857/g.25727 Transcript_26857/m.25727 type:complete len:185 (+) Transcript_26857:215-769(+)|eukprot:CAMPEP_0197828472 /NCGR_PEP_ID=MMETSP1437-20131217/5022_1 /TAXON_ID=49252 ORGANISM="Eucampia antarctica, Strain CCMP1452" /NCGR_SAMPLE_ID=MMETSP1437 /ASSEMBLY_ACC=CAM_ASM_001096 /LENGTH=184 /DNA_ID=CAMNT_0043429681 /DNA_START=114 /DNA_END=668 /DNA_ORIENTATION=+
MKSTTSILSVIALAPCVVSGYSPNPVISVASKGMSLLKPLFKAEAEIQAAVLGAISKVDKDAIMDEINDNKTKNKALIYTYGLSPFSSEALNILDGTDYEFTQIELGAEWFLLGGKESVTRVALSNLSEDGATSLPKIFIGGECIGGCSALTDLAESGELESKLAKAKVPKKGQAAPKKFSFFN